MFFAQEVAPVITQNTAGNNQPIPTNVENNVRRPRASGVRAFSDMFVKYAAVQFGKGKEQAAIYFNQYIAPYLQKNAALIQRVSSYAREYAELFYKYGSDTANAFFNHRVRPEIAENVAQGNINQNVTLNTGNRTAVIQPSQALVAPNANNELLPPQVLLTAFKEYAAAQIAQGKTYASQFFIHFIQPHLQEHKPLIDRVKLQATEYADLAVKLGAAAATSFFKTRVEPDLYRNQTFPVRNRPIPTTAPNAGTNRPNSLRTQTTTTPPPNSLRTQTTTTLPPNTLRTQTTTTPNTSLSQTESNAALHNNIQADNVAARNTVPTPTANASTRRSSLRNWLPWGRLWGGGSVNTGAGLNVTAPKLDGYEVNYISDAVKLELPEFIQRHGEHLFTRYSGTERQTLLKKWWTAVNIMHKTVKDIQQDLPTERWFKDTMSRSINTTNMTRVLAMVAAGYQTSKVFSNINKLLVDAYPLLIFKYTGSDIEENIKLLYCAARYPTVAINGITQFKEKDQYPTKMSDRIMKSLRDQAPVIAFLAFSIGVGLPMGSYWTFMAGPMWLYLKASLGLVGSGFVYGLQRRVRGHHSIATIAAFKYTWEKSSEEQKLELRKAAEDVGPGAVEEFEQLLAESKTFPPPLPPPFRLGITFANAVATGARKIQGAPQAKNNYIEGVGYWARAREASGRAAIASSMSNGRQNN